MFFSHNYHQNYHDYHHNYHCNHHYHHRDFFGHTRKTLFLTSKKEDQVARIGGMGGEVIWAMPERKQIYVWCFLLSTYIGSETSRSDSSWAPVQLDGDNFL